MRITNRHGLPEAFVRAVENDPYDNGGSDFSATSLDQPARASALIAKYKDQLEIDASSKVAVIIGQGAHTIAERAARPGIDVAEKRYFADLTVDNAIYTLSAQIDLFEKDTGNLYDWKTTKAYAFHKKAGGGKKPEWIAQMNIGAWIMRSNDLVVKFLTIIAMLKDWNKREALTPGYPPSEVIAVDLPMWTNEETTKYIETRVRAHVAAKSELPKCSSKETWGGNRCAGYCDAAAVCSQYQEAKKTGLIEGNKE